MADEEDPWGADEDAGDTDVKTSSQAASVDVAPSKAESIKSEPRSEAAQAGEVAVDQENITEAEIEAKAPPPPPEDDGYRKPVQLYRHWVRYVISIKSYDKGFDNREGCTDKKIQVLIIYQLFISGLNFFNTNTCITTEPTITMMLLITLTKNRLEWHGKFLDHKLGLSEFSEHVISSKDNNIINNFFLYEIYNIIFHGTICTTCFFSGGGLDSFVQSTKRDKQLIQTLAASIRTYNYHTKAYINQKYASVL